MVRRRKRALEIDELVRMAMMRFNIADTDAGFTPVTSVAAAFEREQAVVSRAILRAFREGHVRVVATSFEAPQRLHVLEQRIESRFPRTRAVVVRTPTSSDDDNLHRLLGRAMADLIVNGHIFRDDETVGVGGGRAVYFTIQGMLDLLGGRKLPVEDLTLVSLVGSLFPQDLARRLNVKLDADLNVNMLGPCFQVATPRTLNVRLSFLDQKIVASTLREWAVSDPFREGRLTHALVGLGVVDQHHRMRHLAKMGRGDYQFGGIVDTLGELLALSDTYSDSKTSYHPLAEVCCRLFVVEPERIAPPDLQRMRQLISQIDRRFLSISSQALRKVGALLMVGGGRLKGSAIRQFLEFGTWRFRYISTDEEAAAKILGSD